LEYETPYGIIQEFMVWVNDPESGCKKTGTLFPLCSPLIRSYCEVIQFSDFIP